VLHSWHPCRRILPSASTLTHTIHIPSHSHITFPASLHIIPRIPAFHSPHQPRIPASHF
jgi:hypothetical protein